MDMLDDLRTSERIRVANPVELVTADRSVYRYATAINVSMGGLLLNPTPPLAVGSPCKLAILPSDEADGKSILVEGTVVRKDPQGTAIRFSRQLDHRTFDTFARQGDQAVGRSILHLYRDYFRVGQDKDHAGSQHLLHVSPRLFRSVCLASFLTCIPLAILPIWALRNSLPMVPDWLKVTTAFAYAAFWLFIIQPSADLLIFKLKKNKQ